MPLDLLSTRMQVCRYAPSEERSVWDCAPDLYVHLCTLYFPSAPFPCLLLRMVCLHVCCCELSVTQISKRRRRHQALSWASSLKSGALKACEGFTPGGQPVIPSLMPGHPLGSPCRVRDVSQSSACDVIACALGRTIIRPGAGAEARHPDSSIRTLEGTHKSQSRCAHLTHTADIGMRPWHFQVRCVASELAAVAMSYFTCRPL